MTEPFVIARTATGQDVAVSARARQPPRADHRRHRHRQDRHAAGARRALLAHRRAGVPGRREGRSLRASPPPGTATPKLQRAAEGDRHRRAGVGAPARSVFWDVFGKRGHPVRATISDMGPLLLGRLLGLNETQQGVLALVFKIADDNGLLLLDLKDLRAMLQFVGDNAREFTTEYGNVSAASIGAIQRGLLEIEQQGGDAFFGEPMLDIADLMQTDARRPRRRQHPRRRQADPTRRSSTRPSCCGCCRSCSSSCRKSATPTSRSWCSSSTRRTCCSTTRRRRCVEKIEQVVRLIRSKGVGVYFVTQNPSTARHRARPARQPRAARAARLHAARSEGGEGRRRDAAAESEARHRARDHRAGGRRGAGLAARREGQPDGHRARVDCAAGVADRADRRRRARRHPQGSGAASTATTSRRSIASRRTRS